MGHENLVRICKSSNYTSSNLTDFTVVLKSDVPLVPGSNASDGHNLPVHCISTGEQSQHFSPEYLSFLKTVTHSAI